MRGARSRAGSPVRFQQGQQLVPALAPRLAVEVAQQARPGAAP